MKLEEAIAWLNNLFFDFKELGNVYTLTEEDLDAAHTLISHAEATRWRKLGEENPPPEMRYYAVWSSWSNTGESAWWDFDEDLQEWGFHLKSGWSHWRPQVGPEEES